MNVNTYRAVIEGVLFLVGDEGCGVKEMAAILELSVKETESMMQEMMEQFEADEQKGLMIVYLGGKYKLATKTQFKPYFEKMVSQAEASLSNAALETLAIIAYNQPVTRTKIEEIRGVSSDAMVRKLQAKALIKEVGREDTPGKPILYGVSEEFMDAFNLASLDELPDLQNIAQTSMEEDLFDAKYREEDDKANESAG
ncbi:MAG: SMC-Scp complex subunit ScpB [Beduini sp.]|uniref:SMC-Scp complex subunit ScpB n=1 Tax=Beduini sp. TaxID=1922300 RepID=UPI0011CAB6F3